MKIASWNVNGIRACINKGFFEWLYQSDFDVVCLQETKISEDQLSDEMVSPDHGYRSFFNSADRKGYSGTAVFYRGEAPVLNKEFAEVIFTGEGRIIEAAFEKFILYNVYFPNGQMNDERLQYKLDFYREFLKYTLAKKEETGKEVMITGDFNTAHTAIDLKNPKANENYSGFLPVEREWIDKYLAAGYHDIFRLQHPGEEGLYTWWTYRFNARKNNAGWRIDYFLITEGLKDKVTGSYIHSDVLGSDHCPVSLELQD